LNLEDNNRATPQGVIARRLCRLRQKEGISLRDLETKIHHQYSYIHRVEAGKHLPSDGPPPWRAWPARGTGSPRRGLHSVPVTDHVTQRMKLTWLYPSASRSEPMYMYQMPLFHESLARTNVTYRPSVPA
jgi:hypothetical protein